MQTQNFTIVLFLEDLLELEKMFSIYLNPISTEVYLPKIYTVCKFPLTHYSLELDKMLNFIV